MDHRFIFLFFWPVVLGKLFQMQLLNATLEPSQGTWFSELSGEGLTFWVNEDEDDIEYFVTLFLNDSSGNMAKVKTFKIYNNEDETAKNEWIYRNVQLPYGVQELSLKNFSCIVYNFSRLSCTWDIENIPEYASLSTLSLSLDKRTRKFNCFINKKGKAIECQVEINDKEKHLTVHVNVSFPNVWYIHVKTYEIKDIEKLNPPQNISVSVISGNLQIQWDPPANINSHCFHYQLRINDDELMDVLKERMFILRNVDLTKKYSVQMRVSKTKLCRMNNIWSDWSEILSVNPSKHQYGLNFAVIAAIGLAVPTLLLALLLICNNRVFEKLFPSVPSPSIKINNVLENYNFVQAIKSQYVEEITKVEDTTTDECTKMSVLIV